MSDRPLVNAWTEWGTLEEVVVGRADNAIYNEPEVNYSMSFADETFKKWMPYPSGPRHPDTIARCNAELANLAQVLQSECVRVQSKNEFSKTVKRNIDKMVTDANPVAEAKDQRSKEYKKVGAKIHRPSIMMNDHYVKTPTYEVHGTTAPVNPRDVLITIGNTVFETPMVMKRRQFEILPYRHILYDLYGACKQWKWRAAPRPTLQDDMYHKGFSKYTPQQKLEHIERTLEWSMTESQIAFDAAAMTRCGADVFYCRSRACNHLGMDWMQREVGPQVRMHAAHFPDDVDGSHIDVILVPLRAPKGLHGTPGLVMYNSVWPPLKSEMKIWSDNNWDIVAGPDAATDYDPTMIHETRHLNLNLLSLSEKLVLIEECETPLYKFLEEHGWPIVQAPLFCSQYRPSSVQGFDVITVPMHNVYEFEGGIHCTTWDIRRDDALVDYFPDQTNAQSTHKLAPEHRDLQRYKTPRVVDWF